MTSIPNAAPLSASRLRTTRAKHLNRVPEISHLGRRALHQTVSTRASNEAVATSVEDDGLPLRYDPRASEEYFRHRPLMVATRATEIIGLTANWGLGVWMDEKRGLKDENKRTRARQLRNLLTALGPTFVKAGQALSIRVDLLPKEYLEELRQLQDNVPSYPTDTARKLIEKELKMPSWRGGVDAIFSEFPEQPIAAASLGQVYRARVKATGLEVAVKVQRPNMLPGILLDLYLLRVAVPILKKSKNLNTDLVGIVDEWGTRFVDELDYRREARNAAQFGEAMRARGLSSLCTAEAVPELTTRRVLTTEWVEGTRLDGGTFGDEARLCGLALNGYLTMLLDTGVLHADPHPGNLLRTTDGRLCILDFGLVTELTEEQQYSIIEYIAHLISENFTAVPGDLGRLGFVPAGKEAAMEDAGVVKVLAEAFSRLASGGGAKALSSAGGNKKGGGVDELGAELKAVADKWGNLFQIPPYFAYILRAFSVLEGIGLQCDPDYAIAQECYPYLARRLFTDTSPRGKAALREMLYGAGEQEALNVKRLTKLSGAAQTFREVVADGPEGAAPAVSRASSEAAATTRRTATSEMADILLAPQGSYLQELLVKEGVRMTDVAARDAIRAAAESPAGKVAQSVMQTQRDAAAALGPARRLVFPFPLPHELVDWASPILSERAGDDAVRESSQELSDLVLGNLRPAADRLASAEQRPASGASDTDEDTLEQLPQLVNQYGPGLQFAANSFRVELIRLAASRMTEANRPEVSFPLPVVLMEQDQPDVKQIP